MFPRRDFCFERVDAGIFPDGKFFVQWWVSPTFPFTTMPVFYVDIATAVDNWQRLDQVPVINNCVFVGDQLARCGSVDSTYVRVAALDGSTEYLSQPSKFLGELSRHDYTIARDILRKEYLRLKKYSGCEGLLFKRKQSGVKCPECTDWDVTSSPGKSQCKTCYGTGYVGGYYDGFPFWMDIGNDNSNRDINQPFGTTDMQVRTGRCVAYPTIEPYDMWQQAGTNKRFIIRKTQATASLKTMVLVYTVELNAIPYSGIEYSVPEHQDTVPYPGLPAESSKTGWRSGITYVTN